MKEDLDKGKDILCSHVGSLIRAIILQRNLQIECNHYKNFNFFPPPRNRKANPKIHMKLQIALNNQKV